MGKSKGFGLYLAFIVVLILIVYFTKNISESKYDNYTFKDFSEALNNKQIQAVTIVPSEDVPMGVVKFSLSSGQRAKIICSDVKEMEQILRDANIPYS